MKEIILKKEKCRSKDRKIHQKDAYKRIEKALKHYRYVENGKEYKLSVLSFASRVFQIYFFLEAEDGHLLKADCFLSKKTYYRLLKGDFVYDLKIWKDPKTNEFWLTNKIPKSLNEMILEKI